MTPLATTRNAAIYAVFLFVGWIAASATIDALVSACLWPGMSGACDIPAPADAEPSGADLGGVYG